MEDDVWKNRLEQRVQTLEEFKNQTLVDSATRDVREKHILSELQSINERFKDQSDTFKWILKIVSGVAIGWVLQFIYVGGLHVAA